MHHSKFSSLMTAWGHVRPSGRAPKHVTIWNLRISWAINPKPNERAKWLHIICNDCAILKNPPTNLNAPDRCAKKCLLLIYNTHIGGA